MEKYWRRNFQIRSPQVRVIDENGKQLGVLTTRDAVNSAMNKGYDLVEVAPEAQPPVCRVMEFSKFLYERQKKEKEARKHSRHSQLKEIRFRPKTSEHDLETKQKKLIEFLDAGHKVRVVLFFRGREKEFMDEGAKKMAHLLDMLNDKAKVDRPPMSEGNRLIAVLSHK